jgi:signal transduction histidine kinase
MMPVPSPQRRWKELLTEPTHLTSTNAHLVQFYEEDGFLTRAVFDFVATGLSEGEAVLVVATEAHCSGVLHELNSAGIAVDSFLQSGQLTFADAQDTLDRLTVNGQIDHACFNSVIAHPVKALSDKFGATRAYGEMVGVLTSSGKYDAAIELEELWCTLVAGGRMKLMCGYPQSSFTEHDCRHSLRSICDLHSHILPSEKFLLESDPDKCLRMIADLQIQARSLWNESSRRKHAEDAYEQCKFELRKAIVARDEFLSIASHELKTPITSLKLQTEINLRQMRRRDPRMFDQEFVEKTLSVTNRQVNRLTKLVDDMLDVSRVGQGGLQLLRDDMDYSELLIEVLERFEFELKTAGCSHTVKMQQPLRGLWDRLRLEQVLVNLCGNAVKYASGKPIEISLNQENDQAIFKIRDHGPGIAAENLERIFERYERATPTSSIPGLGLGLYISRQIAELHGGTLTAESTPEEGAAFTLRLPLRN